MTRRRRTSIVAAIALAVCGAAALRLARPSVASATPYAPPAGAIELHVPHARGAIVLDGDMDDPGWLAGCARTGPFVLGDGSQARPYSDARLAWGDDVLYVALYAADEDLRATHAEPDAPLWLDDAFHLAFEDARDERTIDVSPRGTITDARRALGGRFDYAWQSGAHVSKEIDGTLDDPSDDDEEWVIEMAIPLASLGLRGQPGERIGFHARRCDVPKGGARTCAAWGEAGDGAARGVIVLD